MILTSAPFVLSSLKDPLFSLFSLPPKDPFTLRSCPHIPIFSMCECPPGTSPLPFFYVKKLWPTLLKKMPAPQYPKLGATDLYPGGALT